MKPLIRKKERITLTPKGILFLQLIETIQKCVPYDILAFDTALRFIQTVVRDYTSDDLKRDIKELKL